MDEVLWYKFTQHHDLRQQLTDTEDAELIEVRTHVFEVGDPTFKMEMDAHTFFSFFLVV